MERSKGPAEKSRRIMENFNITPNDVHTQIEKYQKNIPIYKEWQKSKNENEQCNGYVFGYMCEERLRVLTKASPEQTIDTLRNIYTDTNNLHQQGLDELDISIKLIRKYRSILEYIDLFSNTRSYFLARIAETSIVARWKEEKRLRPTFRDCKIALTLEDYNALDMNPPQELINYPGKTKAETMTDEELKLHINWLRQRYEMAVKEKRKLISANGKAKYEEESKEFRIYAIYEYLISEYQETVKYLRSIGRFPKKQIMDSVSELESFQTNFQNKKRSFPSHSKNIQFFQNNRFFLQHFQVF